MIAAVRAWLDRHWPHMRLRTIIFATLLTVATLPGIAAMFLRVYENTLVRQTEAELIMQGAALIATAEANWPGAGTVRIGADEFMPEPSTIDLSSDAIFAERPEPRRVRERAEADAIAVATSLEPVLARTKQVTLSSIVVLDEEGRLAEEGPGRSLGALPEVRSALAGRSATVLRRNASYRAVYRFEWLSRAAAVRVHHARPIVVEDRVVGVLLLSRSARSLFKGLYADRGKIALGIATIFAILLVLTAVLSRGIVRPVVVLGRATRELAKGRGSIPPPPRKAAVEIQGLYEDYARMAQQIDRRSRYLRDFAHAVSHEFKTPLSAIRGVLEILSDHGDTMEPDERKRFLDNADQDAARLALLSSRLLELARADMGAIETSETWDIAPLLHRLANAYRGEDFAVRLDLPDHMPHIALPEASFDAIASALIENARQAGASVMRIEADLASRAIFTFADDGPGFPEGDRTRIFEPFFTTRRSSGGSGLGLPIVRSLVEAAGGKVECKNATGGATFEVSLPFRM